MVDVAASFVLNKVETLIICFFDYSRARLISLAEFLISGTSYFSRSIVASEKICWLSTTDPRTRVP